MLQLTRWYLLNVYILYVRKCTFAHIQCWHEFAKCRFAHFPSIFSAHVDTYENPWVILLTSGLLFDITTGLHLVLYRHLAVNVAGGDICGKTPAFRSKKSRVAKRDDFHPKLLFFVKLRDNGKQKAVQK